MTDTIAPDGFTPRFVAHIGGTVHQADAVSDLLALGVERTIDLDAVAVFLRVGFYVGDDTPFRAIRAATPRVRAFSGPANDVSRDEAIDRFNALVRDDIQASLPAAPFELPLSGGRDSRHLLFELIAAGRPPRACVTVEHYPPRGHGDIEIAAALCRRFGIRHLVLRQPAERLRVEQEKNRRTHLLTDEHAQFVVLADYLRRQTPITFDGIGGDVLSQSSYLTPEALECFDTRDVARIARFVLDGYGSMVGEGALEAILAPAFYREVSRERALARLEREVARHLDAPNPVASFFYWNRTRREIALSPYGLMAGVAVRAPFLATAVVDFLSGLPARMLLDRRFHTDALTRAFPQHADLPYESSRELRRGGRAHHRRFAVDLLRLSADRGHGLRHRALAARWAATIVDGNHERLWSAPLVIYLTQLMALASRAR